MAIMKLWSFFGPEIVRARAFVVSLTTLGFPRRVESSTAANKVPDISAYFKFPFSICGEILLA
ncbi:hypothetical protein [Martelella sp. FOR1707]